MQELVTRNSTGNEIKSMKFETLPRRLAEGTEGNCQDVTVGWFVLVITRKFITRFQIRVIDTRFAAISAFF